MSNMKRLHLGIIKPVISISLFLSDLSSAYMYSTVYPILSL